MKKGFSILFFGFCIAFALSVFSCNDGNDSALIAIPSPSGGGESPSPTPTPTPVPTTYTITFNANDGTQNPSTATQTFTSGTPQALTTIAELGFSKNGFTFAGWGRISDATESSYSDGAAYTATADATLYALWSAIPVYSVNIPVNENGTVTASPATAMAGTEITLANTPKDGYKFGSYTVTANDGSNVSIANGKFVMPAQNVTVTTVFVLKVDYKKIDSVTINGTTYDLVTFGLWPQTIKASDVDVYQNIKETHGVFTYCKGSDGEWYFKQAENAANNSSKYSDGTKVANSSANSVKWFKVEPIKWRVLSTNYDGKKLFLAENALIGKRYDNENNNYKDSEIRAWLNGDFLQSAFTSLQQDAIQTTTIDNSARSTNPNAEATRYNGGNNEYACSNTDDKIFLLSKQEATKSDYGFEDGVGKTAQETYDPNRVRGTTDFSLATGLRFGVTGMGLGCVWYLRSPADLNYRNVQNIDGFGRTSGISRCEGGVFSNGTIESNVYGIVPALCVEN